MSETPLASDKFRQTVMDMKMVMDKKIREATEQACSCINIPQYAFWYDSEKPRSNLIVDRLATIYEEHGYRPYFTSRKAHDSDGDSYTQYLMCVAWNAPSK